MFTQKILERKTVSFWVRYGKRFYKKNEKRLTKVPKTVRNGTWNGTRKTQGYGTVRYGTLRYATVRYGTLRYATLRYGTLRYGHGRRINGLPTEYSKISTNPITVQIQRDCQKMMVMVCQVVQLNRLSSYVNFKWKDVKWSS